MPSTVIADFSYHPAKRDLDVLFRTGWLYRYHGVPGIVVQAMKAAPSKGVYFNANIRNRYRYTRVGKADRIVRNVTE
jgi:hypothetical protein